MARKSKAAPANETTEQGAAQAQEQPQAPAPVVADAVAQQLADTVAAQAAQDQAAIDPATGEIIDPDHEQFGTEAHAESFICGELMKVAKQRFTQLAEPWGKLKQSEQAQVLRWLHEDVKGIVKRARQIIAGNGRTMFEVDLGKVTFDAPKVTGAFELRASPEAHELAKASNQKVVVLIEKLDTLLSVPAQDLEGDDDNMTLFDASQDAR